MIGDRLVSDTPSAGITRIEDGVYVAEEYRHAITFIGKLGNLNPARFTEIKWPVEIRVKDGQSMWFEISRPKEEPCKTCPDLGSRICEEAGPCLKWEDWMVGEVA